MLLKRNGMMFAIITLLVLLLIPISSCVPDTPEPPYGVWMSEDPHIILYFKPEYRLPFPHISYIGFYTVDGVETRVFAHFGNGMRFTIYGLDGITEGGGIRGLGIIGGRYRIRGGEMHLSHMDETIIFRPLETYTPIDPYDWFPHFFPRTPYN